MRTSIVLRGHVVMHPFDCGSQPVPHFDATAMPGPLDDFVRIADINGDGKKEVLIAAPTKIGLQPGRSAPGGGGLPFERWETALGLHSANNRTIPQQRTSRAMEAVRPVCLHRWWFPSQDLCGVAHYRWGNSLVVELDPKTGKDTIRYVNNGVIWKLAEMRTPSGTYLLAGGFNSEHDAGILAIMNESRPFAASPQTGRYRCTSCPKGHPILISYSLAPRSTSGTRYTRTRCGA